MFVILQPAILTFFTTFSSAEVEVGSRGVGVRDHSLDGMVSSDHLLFQADVSSKAVCASTCLKDSCCLAFSASPKDPASRMLTCRGHDSKAVSLTATITAPGTKTYFIEDKKESASSWLERTCATVSDCPAAVANIACFDSQCLCQPGYYYSHCRDACVSNCVTQDLQSTFLVYPNRYLAGYNIPGAEVGPCSTVEAGRIACLQTPQCRSVDISTNVNKCFPQADTALADPASFKTSQTATHIQITCL